MTQSRTYAMQSELSRHPLVSVIVPVFNEEGTIRGCVAALLSQDYPPERTEIILVDGNSTDRTVPVIRELQTADSRIKLLHNPRRYIPYALNTAIRAAEGEIIVRMDAHAVPPAGYVSTCVRYLLTAGFDCVGGRMHALGTSFWGRTIAAATSCPFGIGNSRHRYARTDVVGEPPWLGAFRKDTLLRLGGYDERFVINEDDELYFRMKKQGLSLLLIGGLETKYYCRDSLQKLFVQYFRYGFWKARVMAKHGGPATLRHCIPSAFVVVLAVSVAAPSVFPPAAPAALVLLVAYLAPALLFSLQAAAGNDWRLLLSMPIAFLTLHLSYGTGVLGGLVAVLGGRRK